MQLVPVDPDEVPNFKEGRRGRVSYPLLKMFLETGMPVCKLDRTGMQNSLQSLTSCLTGYVRNHELPVKIFTRSGELYLARTDDPDDEGNYNNNVNEVFAKRVQAPSVPTINATPITADEVAMRFDQEIGQVTK